MSNNSKNCHAVKILAVIFVIVLAVGAFWQNSESPVRAARFSFVGEDSNVTTNIKLNGKDTGAVYTRVHLGSGGSAGWGANKIINIVEANLEKNPNLTFEVINCGTYTENARPLTEEVNKYKEDDKKILAAVNGDWMSGVKKLGASVTANYRVTFSPVVIDTEIWCSQMPSIEQDADYFTLCITTDNKVTIGKPTVDVKVKNDTTGKIITPTGFNRAPVNNSLNLYNNRLNDSNYVSEDAYEVVIKADTTNKLYNNQKITGTVTNMYKAETTEPAGLDDNILILTARGSQISYLQGKFSMGDKVTISSDIKCTEDRAYWENCEEAIGGQCLVMKDGKINNELLGGSADNYPTNIIGYKSDGTIMMTMVTADTDGVRKGLVFNKQIDDFCKEIGYDTCFLFDGGGSTTMITLDNNKYVERACYSDGSIRSVWNGLALVYDETPDVPATPTPVATPTKSPATPTKAPTVSVAPSKTPKATPTNTPTVVPTVSPTESSSADTTAVPTIIPTEKPTVNPTETLTESPSEATDISSSDGKNDTSNKKSNVGIIIAVVISAVIIIGAVITLVVYLKKKK